MRELIRRILAVILRIFFPRIEISNADRVPASGPVILVVNHPNGLIDPLFLICLLERPVSFLAKSTLFDMPVIGWFVKALGSIPVYRRQDQGFDWDKNQRTFERARAILGGGGIIALFPEGSSHDEPKLRPLKTGAARIALGAAPGAGADTAPLTVAPMGIYYTAKGIFRSEALLYFGEPMTIIPPPAGAEGEPEPNAVRELTARLESALSDVTLQADEHEALALIARAEQLYSVGEPASGARLTNQFERRRRFLAGYTTLRRQAPDRLAAVLARLSRYESELALAGVDRDTLLPQKIPPLTFAGRLLAGIALALVLLPAALTGTIVNYPAYRLVGFIATGLSRGEEGMLATVKLLAGALLFPLSWIAVAVAVGLYYGLALGLVALVAAPVTGYVALRFFERLDELRGWTHSVALARFQRWGYLRLVAERNAIREEIGRLAEELT